MILHKFESHILINSLRASIDRYLAHAPHIAGGTRIASNSSCSRDDRSSFSKKSVVEEDKSEDKKFMVCGLSGHFAADRKCKPNYGVIRQILLDKGLSVSDAAAIVASMIRTH